jgi:hypothetical protein
MEYIALCMRAQGYEFFDDHCPDQSYLIPKLDPDYLKSLSEEQQDRLHIERGGKMIAADRQQRSDPACYEPMGWFGKKVLRFERYWGMAPDWQRGRQALEKHLEKLNVRPMDAKE